MAGEEGIYAVVNTWWKPDTGFQAGDWSQVRGWEQEWKGEGGAASLASTSMLRAPGTEGCPACLSRCKLISSTCPYLRSHPRSAGQWQLSHFIDK